VAVARARCLGRPLVAGAPQKGRQLVPDGALEDELGAEAPELAQLVGTASIASSIAVLGATLRSTAWSPSATCKVRFGAYAVFTSTACSGRHRHRHDTAGSGEREPCAYGNEEPATP
jgi:hypothetical protein